MTATEYARAARFGHAFARRQAARVVAVPGGFAALDPDRPAVHSLNRLHATAPVAGPFAAADDVLGEAGLRHRLVGADGPGDAAFTAAGYEAGRELLTPPAYRGRGYATALVAAGVRRAAAGCDLAFLRVDADDGPVRRHRRLGFYPMGDAHQLRRAGATRPTDADARPADGS